MHPAMDVRQSYQKIYRVQLPRQVEPSALAPVSALGPRASEGRLTNFEVVSSNYMLTVPLEPGGSRQHPS